MGGQKRQGDRHSDIPSSGRALRELHGDMQLALDHYWSVWAQQYITNLPPVVRNHKIGDQLKENDLVMIRDEPYKARLLWPLARVVKIHPGKDGVGRCATLQTAGSELVRPVKRLHRLEIHQEAIAPLPENMVEEAELEEVNTPEVQQTRKSQSPNKVEYTSRAGRKTTAPVSYR